MINYLSNPFNRLFSTYSNVELPQENTTPQYEEESYIEFPSFQFPLSEMLNRMNEKLEEKEGSNKEEKKDLVKDNYNEIFGKKFDKEFVLMTPFKEQALDKKKHVFKDKNDFISTMRPIYYKALADRGLDTNYTDYLVAQAGLESGWGKSQSGTYNLGGIKLPKKLQGKGLGTIVKTTEYINGVKQPYVDEFRNFKDLKDYANFHIDFLNKPSYNAFNGDFVTNVIKGGYATDPNYAKKLKSVYNSLK